MCDSASIPSFQTVTVREKRKSQLQNRSQVRTPVNPNQNYVRLPGFEPELEAWEASVLPLDYSRLIATMVQ